MPEPYLKYSADQMRFNGYATRYLSPRETGSWRVRNSSMNVQVEEFWFRSENVSNKLFQFKEKIKTKQNKKTKVVFNTSAALQHHK